MNVSIHTIFQQTRFIKSREDGRREFLLGVVELSVKNFLIIYILIRK